MFLQVCSICAAAVSIATWRRGVRRRGACAADCWARLPWATKRVVVYASRISSRRRSCQRRPDAPKVASPNRSLVPAMCY